MEALGELAYEMLTGRKPSEEFVPVTQARPELPRALDDFFLAALSDDPERRPADAATFRTAFEACWG
jgi:hypothetical protein